MGSIGPQKSGKVADGGPYRPVQTGGGRMRGYLLTPARRPQCTTISWFDQPKRQNESLPVPGQGIGLARFRMGRIFRKGHSRLE
jgi:hypothetical protein